MIVVTGGAGFIGSHVVDRLQGLGEDVACIDNFDPYYPIQYKKDNVSGFLEVGGSFYEADITDFDSLCDVFCKTKPDTVIHLAAKAGVRPSIQDPQAYVRNNVDGTLNVLDACKKHHVERLIFGSSSSVYGDANNVPYREDGDITKPISPYAATKVCGESLCHAYSRLYGLNTSVLRFFTVYGPRGRPDMAPYKFTKLIDDGSPIEVYGDGSSSRDYTYVDDIVDGIVSCCDKDHSFEAFNLGGSETTSLKEFIRIIEDGLGKKADIIEKGMQPGDVLTTCADVSKAGDLLDYSPKVRVADGMMRFIDWYMKERAGI